MKTSLIGTWNKNKNILALAKDRKRLGKIGNQKLLIDNANLIERMVIKETVYYILYNIGSRLSASIFPLTKKMNIMLIKRLHIAVLLKLIKLNEYIQEMNKDILTLVFAF